MLGCSQDALRDAAQERLDGRVELLRRESGGGAVLTGPWLLGVSVVLPSAHPWLGGGLLESYRHFAQLHGSVLAKLGIAAQLLAPDRVVDVNERLGPMADWACFGSLSPWELVDAQGRKLVGLAQRRRQTGVLLVAGTLIATPSWHLLCHAMGRAQDEAQLQRRTVSCEALAGRPLAAQTLASAMQQALAQALRQAA